MSGPNWILPPGQTGVTQIEWQSNVCPSQTGVETIVIEPRQQLTFGYPNTSYCVGPNSIIPLTNFPVPGPGSFNYQTILGGNININISSGAINLGTADPGVYRIIYQVPLGTCYRGDTFQLEIVTGATADFTIPSTVCVSQGTVTPTLANNATPGGTWSTPSNSDIVQNNGVINLAASLANGSGPYTITYTVGSGSCLATHTEPIANILDVNADFSLPATTMASSTSPNPWPMVRDLIS